ALAGLPYWGPKPERFWQGGLPALIQSSSLGFSFLATLEAVPRPPWTPYEDPRQEVLAQVYRLLSEEPDPLALGIVGWGLRLTPGLPRRSRRQGGASSPKSRPCAVTWPRPSRRWWPSIGTTAVPGRSWSARAWINSATTPRRATWNPSGVS